MNEARMASKVLLVNREKKGESSGHNGDHQNWGSWQPLLKHYPKISITRHSV